jgi:hypothetical protein
MTTSVLRPRTFAVVSCVLMLLLPSTVPHARAPIGAALLFSYFTGRGDDGLQFMAPPSQCHEL